MRGEALKLQGKAEASRRRARERLPDRSKEQVQVRRLHATLAVAYSEALQATKDSVVTAATKVGLKTLGLDHLPEALFKHIQVSPNWAYLLRAEIKKMQAKRLKLDKTHLREGKRRRDDAKKNVFDHGIKGVRRVTRKHGTVTHLQQVDQSCLTGLRWDISPAEVSRSNFKSEVEEWTSSLPPEIRSRAHRITHSCKGQDPHRCARSACMVDPTSLSRPAPTNTYVFYRTLEQGESSYDSGVLFSAECLPPLRPVQPSPKARRSGPTHRDPTIEYGDWYVGS